MGWIHENAGVGMRVVIREPFPVLNTTSSMTCNPRSYRALLEVFNRSQLAKRGWSLHYEVDNTLLRAKVRDGGLRDVVREYAILYTRTGNMFVDITPRPNGGWEGLFHLDGLRRFRTTKDLSYAISFRPLARYDDGTAIN